MSKMYVECIDLHHRRNKDTDFEDMESLELNVLTLVSEHVHHHLEICLLSDVTRHNAKVCTIQQDFAKEFEGLSLGDVVVGENESGKGREELVVTPGQD
jgi:hypothetical protein